MLTYRKPNIERAFEAVLVTRLISDQPFTLFIHGLPSCYKEIIGHPMLTDQIDFRYPMVEYGEDTQETNYTLEPFNDVITRAYKALAYTKQNTIDTTLCDATLALLKTAITKKNLTADQTENIKTLAKSIAAMAFKPKIDIIHIAEAIQYFSSNIDFAGEDWKSVFNRHEGQPPTKKMLNYLDEHYHLPLVKK